MPGIQGRHRSSDGTTHFVERIGVWSRGGMIAAAAAFTILGLSGEATALAVGDTVEGYAEVNGRQVPLPEGKWIVAGQGHNQVVSGVAGAYGTIENNVLMNIRGDRVRAVIEINTNSISVTEGWGTTDICSKGEALAHFNLYRTAVDGFCFFVDETEAPTNIEEAPAAWQDAVAFAGERNLKVPAAWLTVGYRVSNRHDIVDTRYHFDGLELGALAPGRADWSKKAAHGSPKQFAVVNDLNAWAGLLSELFESGLRGRLPEKLAGNAVPHPLTAIDNVAIDKDKVGLASKAARMKVLDRLVADGVIAAEDLETYRKAVDETAPPPTIEDYYKTLVAKTASYNMFRVSVDYLLAFIVTTNAAVSGYITAAIVATHSVAQIFNDMAWDNYISGQRRDGSELVEFGYFGKKAVEVAQ